MTLDDWKANGAEFKHGANTIFYRREGFGPNLLCIHGFPTSSWDWHKIWPELTSRFDVLAPDMIGFGFSDKPPRIDYSILDQADIHEELCSFLGIHDVHILAHDYGDTVAQELLARFKDRQSRGDGGLTIHSCCFLNGGLFPEMHRPRLIQRLLISPIGKFLTPFLGEEQFRKSFSAVFGPKTQPTDEELKEFWRLMEHNDQRRIMHKLIGYMAERRQYRDRWVRALQEAPCRIRLIDGPADPVSGKHLADYYQQVIPNPDVITLPDHIGHYPQTEAPEKTLKHFLEFIDQER